jgi:Cu(I)/Ag(I) efflux system membrane fusion protein
VIKLQTLFTLVLVLALGLSAGYRLGKDRIDKVVHSAKTDKKSDEGQLRDRKPLYWYDPMYPGTRFDKPGKSPFMDMELVPRYADDGGDSKTVTIDPAVVQNLGLKTTKARKGRLSIVRDLPANVEFNSYNEARVQPRAEGFVSLAGNLAVGDKIEAGREIAVITVPAWASDQSEYLLLKSQNAPARLLTGAREKLRLGGMPEEMLNEVDKTLKVQTSYKIISPLSGVITELSVYPGMNVDKNSTLVVIQGLDPVWVTAQTPQRYVGLVKGAKLRVSSPAYPERVFEIASQSLLPTANHDARTVPLRLEVLNPDDLLKPGMTATIRLRNTGPESLIIPSQSLIDMGEEKRVIVRLPDGSFLPKLVKTSGLSGSETAISQGLNEGDEVVVSGLFLIDSEANLLGALEHLKGVSGESDSKDISDL